MDFKVDYTVNILHQEDYEERSVILDKNTILGLIETYIHNNYLNTRESLEEVMVSTILPL